VFEDAGINPDTLLSQLSASHHPVYYDTTSEFIHYNPDLATKLHSSYVLATCFRPRGPTPQHPLVPTLYPLGRPPSAPSRNSPAAKWWPHRRSRRRVLLLPPTDWPALLPSPGWAEGVLDCPRWGRLTGRPWDEPPSRRFSGAPPAPGPARPPSPSWPVLQHDGNLFG
jgi:hypothetical protein